MQVVEQENDETLGHIRRLRGNTSRRRGFSRAPVTLNRGTPLNRKPGDALWLVVVKKLEIFFFQVVDGVASAIADENRNQNHIYLAFNCECAILSRDFFLLCHQV